MVAPQGPAHLSLFWKRHREPGTRNWELVRVSGLLEPDHAVRQARAEWVRRRTRGNR
jgi:hypothetical protein